MKPSSRPDGLLIWVEAWQHRCCGAEFAVGGTVEWQVHSPARDEFIPILGAELTERLDAVEGHHADRIDRVVIGTVTSISAVHSAYDPHPVPGSAVFTALSVAERWTPDRDGMSCSGYLVGVKVTPA